LSDLRWHLTHDEFEGTSQQLEAHWLLWTGVLATIAAASLAFRAPQRPAGQRGYLITLVSGLFYVPISVWHFIEHASGVDPSVAHVLLAVGQVGMVAGAVVATLAAATRRPLTEP